MVDLLVRPDHFINATRPSFWNPKLEDEFREFAMENHPFEVCAFVIDRELVFVKNVHSNPMNNFELSTEDSLLFTKAQGFVHSHPNGGIEPSATDMRSQISCNIPFGICSCTDDSASTVVWWGDHLLDVTLENRIFIHGIYDCYSLARGYYWQASKIKLQDMPRENFWWDVQKTDDLYLKNFESSGFKLLGYDEELQVGDGLLFDIQTNCVSHSGVYIGNGLILHHLRGRISKKDRFSTWKKFHTHSLRYIG